MCSLEKVSDICFLCGVDFPAAEAGPGGLNIDGKNFEAGLVMMMPQKQDPTGMLTPEQIQEGINAAVKRAMETAKENAQ